MFAQPYLQPKRRIKTWTSIGKTYLNNDIGKKKDKKKHVQRNMSVPIDIGTTIVVDF